MMRNDRRTISLLLVTLALSAGTVNAKEYVVAPTGDDANPGSRAAPFRTIQKAAAVVQPGDTCLVRGGDYFETVTPSAQGTANAPIVFKVWPGERATVWGTEWIVGWESQGKGVYRAPMDWDLGRNNQIFLGGTMATEARWPNVKDEDMLTPEGAKISKGDIDFIRCDQFPDGLPDDHFKGAVLWAMVGAKWTSWSTIVESYDGKAKTLRFNLGKHGGSIARYMNPSDRRGGFFFLAGKREMLDAPGEWYYDDSEKMLYLHAGEQTDLGKLKVTAKRRMLAFNLQGKSHVHVDGFDVVGATIDMSGCEHCVLQDVRARYVSHTRGGNTGYGLNEATGIPISGHHNIIRDSEIAYSAGNGIRIRGHRNEVVNCWLHDINYMGSYECPVTTSGTQHLISHNTIHDAGRDCMQPRGQANLIQYNDMFRMGRICHDLGATYVCGDDGGGTEFRYNWCHDNVAEGTRMGIYLDNFSSSYFVHHNVCWAIGGDAIRLNLPSLYNVVAHNTMLNLTGYWGRWETDWMYGCLYACNVLTEEIERHPQAILVANIEQVGKDRLNKDNFTTTDVGVDKGLVVPGISGKYEGKRPDAGAYEQGMPPWKAGHDFEQRPRPVYRLSETPWRNRIRHGSFDWRDYREQLGPWRRTHAKAAEIVRGRGGISQSYTTRDTIYGFGVCLQGNETDGIEQTIEGLEPNTTYELAGWLKVDDDVEARLGIRGHGGEPVSASTDDSQWSQPHVRFTTGTNVTSAVVFITKRGPGKAWIDDVGVVPVSASLPLGKPGLVRPADNR